MKFLITTLTYVASIATYINLYLKGYRGWAFVAGWAVALVISLLATYFKSDNNAQNKAVQ